MKAYSTPKGFEDWHRAEIERNNRDTARRERILASISMKDQLKLFPVDEVSKPDLGKSVNDLEL